MSESTLSGRRRGVTPRRTALDIARRNRAEPGRPLSAVMKTAATARELADAPPQKRTSR